MRKIDKQNSKTILSNLTYNVRKFEKRNVKKIVPNSPQGVWQIEDKNIFLNWVNIWLNSYLKIQPPTALENTDKIVQYFSENIQHLTAVDNEETMKNSPVTVQVI